MSETQEQLGRKLQTAEELLSIVRVMKAYAASAVGPYMKAVASLEGYAETIEGGLSLCLRRSPRLAEPGARRGPSSTALIAFGSDQGLVGTFNEQLARFLERHLAERANGVRLWVVGERLQAQLRERMARPMTGRSVPESVAGITPLITDLISELEQQGGPPFGSLLIAHHQPVSSMRYEPRVQQLVPFDPAWLEGLKKRPWPTREVPEVPFGARRTFWALVREYLFISLFRACAESLASENVSRLAAMTHAEQNVRDQLGMLRSAFNQQRQQAISDELFDIIAGVEALMKR